MTGPREGSAPHPDPGTDGIASLFASLGFDAELRAARDDTVLRRLGSVVEGVGEDGEGTASEASARRLPRLAFVQERMGLEAYLRYLSRSSQSDIDETVSHFRTGYDAWRSLATLPEDGRTLASERSQASGLSPRGLEVLQTSFPEAPLDPITSLALHMAVAGTLGSRQAEV